LPFSFIKAKLPCRPPGPTGGRAGGIKKKATQEAHPEGIKKKGQEK
jgi:hypothetical protein